MTDRNESIMNGIAVHPSQELGVSTKAKEDDRKELIGQYVQVWKDGHKTRNGRVRQVSPTLAANWLVRTKNHALYEEIGGYSFHLTGGTP